MQTVAEPIDYTKGGTLNPRKGLAASTMATLEAEAMARLAKGVSSTSILGLKQKKIGTTPGMTAGLIQQLSDDRDGRLILALAVDGNFTEASLKAALRILTQTGTPTDIYLSSNNKDTANDFNGSSEAVTVNTDKSNTQAGMYVDTYNYEGLVLNIKIDADMPDDAICIVNINKCKKGPKAGDAIEYHDEGSKSSREDRKSFNGSYGIAIEDVGYEHLIMTGITQPA